jgi:hypothetical protein
VAGQELGKGWSRQEIFFFPPDLGLVDLGEDDVTSTLTSLLSSLSSQRRHHHKADCRVCPYRHRLFHSSPSTEAAAASLLMAIVTSVVAVAPASSSSESFR